MSIYKKKIAMFNLKNGYVKRLVFKNPKDISNKLDV